MPFYRVKQVRSNKSSIKRRPGWDDSVNDLTVYKATPEEIFLRKEAHKSKNHMSVKLEKLRKERQRAKLTGAEAQQLAIMKEVLYDQHELQKVLAKSDTMMAVVKDLFGDDPKRFEGFPNITSAPDAVSDANRSGSLVASIPDIYTRTEKLSDSVMNQSALNDIASETESDSEEEVARPDPISYQPRLNLQRFQDFLHEEEFKLRSDPPSLISQLNRQEEEDKGRRAPSNMANGATKHTNHKGHMNQLLNMLTNGKEEMPTMLDSSGKQSSSTNADKNKSQVTQLLSVLLQNQSAGTSLPEGLSDAQLLSALIDSASDKNKEEADMKTPPKDQHHQQSHRLPSDRTPPSAMNDTKKLKKSKKCTKASESLSTSANTTATMNGMRQALQELECEIASFEQQTGRRPQEESERTETFSGYTIALVSAVGRLTKYLKETDLRVRTEITLREQLTQDVFQLRTIIDALATDVILTQEEYGKLYSEHQRYKENTTATLTSVNKQLLQLRQLVTGQSSHQQKPQGQLLDGQHQHLNLSNSSKKTNDSRTSTPIHSQQDSNTPSGSGSYRPLPANLHPNSAVAAATAVATSTAAIMLSPPVQKTRVHGSTGADSSTAKFTERQSSLVDVPEPPHLTQTPPVMNSVNVPRPIPLVQTNVSVSLPSSGQPQTEQIKNIVHSTQPLSQSSKGLSASQGSGYRPTTLSSERLTVGDSHNMDPKTLMLTQQDQRSQMHHPSAPTAVPGPDLSDLVKMGNETEQQLHMLQELAVEEAMSNPALQELMQEQIAELNRQQEEARRRLQQLLEKQKSQQTQMQQHFLDPLADRVQSPHYRDVQRAILPSQVSPPISPILKKPEDEDGQNRGIVVSLPLVELDVSGASIGSPPSQAAVQ